MTSEEQYNRDRWLMGLAWEASEKSTCLRTKVGAAIGPGKIYTGYSGCDSCKNLGCMRPDVSSGRDINKCRGAHAEIKALFNRINMGNLYGNKILYVTHTPCPDCCRAIIYTDIKEVVYDKLWGDYKLSERILVEAGVKVRQFNYESIKDLR